MKVKRSVQLDEPGYPTWNQYRLLAGVATVGLVALVAGCRPTRTGGVPQPRLRGEIAVEPTSTNEQPRPPGGIKAPADTPNTPPAQDKKAVE